MIRNILLVPMMVLAIGAAAQDASEILGKVDENMSSDNRVFESTMTIHGKRNSRTVASRTWAVGTEKSFTEYLSPASEMGTKMLKLEDQLWIYSPSTDRIIQISGHLLRQSVMGSDLSYEDMMEDRKLTEVYEATVAGEEVVDGRQTWVLALTAKVEDIAYARQKVWVDAARFVPLRQEMYAKSGQLLKRTELREVKEIDGRWFPTVVVYKDMLKDGKGTEFRMTSVRFDQEIPAHIFTKAALRK